MATTISEMKQRIEWAEAIEAECNGNRKHGLNVGEIGEYTIVNDGQDRWLIETDCYTDAVERIIGEVLDGDLGPEDQSMVNRGHDAIEWYSALCSECDCLYSNIGSCEMNLQELFEEIGEDGEDIRREVFEALGEEELLKDLVSE